MADGPTWRVPSASPSIDEDDIAAVADVLRSGVLANGPQAAALEAEFAAYCGLPSPALAIALSSGTSALVLAGQALGLRAGDTVLVAGFTFAASANAFLSLGCDVVPVDVDPVTMNMDPGSLLDAAERHPNARAAVVVDLYGSTIGTAEAVEAARHAGLLVVEDACQAHGARTEDGPLVGARADATTFSLYATKNMSGGEGGLLTTPHPAVADDVRRLRNHGGLAQYNHEIVGLNHRLTEVSAVLARRQLARLDANNAARRDFARDLAQACAGAWGDGVAVPAASGYDARHAFHQFTVRFATAELRDDIAARLRAAGVDARQFYPYTVRELPRVTPAATPVADRLRDTVLSLPVHPGLDGGQRAALLDAIAASRTTSVAA